MKLAAKIVFLVLFGIIALLAIDRYLSVRHDFDLYEADMKRDAHVLGVAMKAMLAEVWREGGRKSARDLMKGLNEEENSMKIRWVRLDAGPDDPAGARASRGRLGPVLEGKETCFKEEGWKGDGFLYTYVPLPVHNGRRGAIEITESLSELADYKRATVLRALALIGTMVLASGLILLVLGVRVVGRPLARLTEKARRIGVGEFSADLELRGRDELSTLAGEMNRMCAQLASAQEAVRAETEARITALEQLRHTERLATLGRLSSGMAHELGTPLNVIAGRAKLIATEDLTEGEIIDSSRIIAAQAERMTKIIRELLDFARCSAPRKSLTNIQELVGRVLGILKPIARKQKAVFIFVDCADPVILSVDSSQIQQVLMNLVMNAIQSMPQGGRIEIGLQMRHAPPPDQGGGREEKMCALYVKDEGEGIEEENRKHVFDPFFTTKGVGEGTGLGLSIAYGIVQEHGGSIDVQSEVGKGTCFTIYLPDNGREPSAWIPGETSGPAEEEVRSRKPA